MLVYLVGNRIDLDDQRIIPKEEGQKYMAEKKFNNFFETSAKTGENVTETFETLTKHLYLVNKAKLEQFVILNVFLNCCIIIER
jgi:GTPase SAR1 family protein